MLGASSKEQEFKFDCTEVISVWIKRADRFVSFWFYTFNKVDILHCDMPSIWGEEVLDTAKHTNQLSIHSVACETLHK